MTYESVRGSYDGDVYSREDGAQHNVGKEETDPETSTFHQGKMRLFRYDPVEVGHILYVEITPGRYVQMKTLAVHPPVFEIPHFLTKEECEHLKNLAMDEGLKTSSTVNKTLKASGVDESKVAFNETEWNTKLHECDLDADSQLDFDEALSCIPGLEADEALPPSDLGRMYVELILDLNSDGFINSRELWLINLPNKTARIRKWLEQWRRGTLPPKGRQRGRVSDQAWIDWKETKHDVIRKLRERVTAVTKLDWKIVHSSESLQVVRYRPGGLYHAHYDSTGISSDTQCGHTARVLDSYPEEKERLCRYATILYYLNDVEEGGETAFPVADMKNNSKEFISSLPYDAYDLSSSCRRNLAVKPETGKAVLWYNHLVDDDTGWMGNRDGFSLHGGCEVTKGIKWIANNWILVDDVYERQMRYQEKIFHESNGTKKDGVGDGVFDAKDATTKDSNPPGDVRSPNREKEMAGEKGEEQENTWYHHHSNRLSSPPAHPEL
ncbi:transmembrane prolyl 4-hydroxylase-like [Diadema antillarum]|uniref:transmembrane prolyl 4-hydroxylase-like n=1 Tax=Diadema antillarum TaxID=105358 RepID=UPI003A85F182